MEGLFWFWRFTICHLLTYLDTYLLTALEPTRGKWICTKAEEFKAKIHLSQYMNSCILSLYNFLF